MVLISLGTPRRTFLVRSKAAKKTVDGLSFSVFSTPSVSCLQDDIHCSATSDVVGELFPSKWNFVIVSIARSIIIPPE